MKAQLCYNLSLDYEIALRNWEKKKHLFDSLLDRLLDLVIDGTYTLK